MTIVLNDLHRAAQSQQAATEALRRRLRSEGHRCAVACRIDGYLYSIDLSSAHAEELRDRLTAYREFGTSLGRYHTRNAAPAVEKRASNRGDRERNLDIRRWAEENHLPIKARGKISDAVVAKYDAAHASRG
ncbi:histone-like nucleoid-structuring protein Lsr2 [Glycomyces sp. YM15]|uniref:Lsr2 family DNA-binding protein n=1 Tax=Glycomyces sp. YM15 TaxID=2800446 RepID=UPI001964E527|nr:histone-like nucleoid-structuring protein Lsr2 [Glycomyces sp. YM15]